MTDKTAQRGRAHAARLTLGTVLVGAGVLASCNVVNAAPIGYGDPYIAQVDHQDGFNGGDGLRHFQVDSWNVGIFVNPGIGGARAHGDLVVTDTANGDVLCELPAKVVENSLADCPAFFGPGERKVVAQYTDHGKTVTTEPVVIESYAEDAPADGIAPKPVNVVGTAPGERGGATAVTLQGTPGDRVIVRDQRHYDALDTTFDASGRVVAQVYVPQGETEHLPYETQRDGKRHTGIIAVTGDPKPYTHAEPLDLVTVERPTDRDAVVVLRGTPGAEYSLHLHNSSVQTRGVVSTDGIIRWELLGDAAGATGLSWQTWGDDDARERGSVDLLADETHEPGTPDPVVPGPGIPVDPGFTVPVVAQPAPGDVDPGFTAPGGEDASDAISVVGVEPSRTADVARVTIQGAAGDRVSLESTDHRFFWAGTLDQVGRASFDVWDFPADTEKTFRGEVRRGEATLPVEFTVTSNARKPVTAEKLELVSTEHGPDGTTVTYRGTPGAHYGLFAVAAGQANGTIPDDGLVRLTLSIPNGQSRTLTWSTYGDAGYHQGEDSIAGPTADPVVAEPNPGETDPGFTAPGEGNGGEQPGDGNEDEQSVVAEPNPGETDPGFTVPDDGNEGDQPGDGNEGEQPVVAEPNPGETDPGFTVPGDEGEQPGDGDDEPGATLEARLVEAVNLTGLVLSDPNASPKGYSVRIIVDGQMRGYRQVTDRPQTRSVPVSEPGEHTLEIQTESGRVLKTLTVTVPGQS